MIFVDKHDQKLKRQVTWVWKADPTKCLWSTEIEVATSIPRLSSVWGLYLVQA